MKVRRLQLGLPIQVTILLLINLILILIICLKRAQLNITTFTIDMFYAAIANIVIGALSMYGNFQINDLYGIKENVSLIIST